MIIASLNGNKRMGSERSRARITRWLHECGAHLVVLQEPWGGEARRSVDIDGYQRIGGNDRVFSWITGGLETPKVRAITPCIQRLEVGFCVLFNCYLDAYAQQNRADQLRVLQAAVREEADRPIIIVGDFNLAPSPSDGLCNGAPSSFNSEVDRQPLRELLLQGDLIDVTAATELFGFTIVRKMQTTISEFRCDLALISRYVSHEIAVKYDHSTRTSDPSLSDHSAILLDVPVTIPAAEDTSGWLFPAIAEDARAAANESAYAPHKTAMARQAQSPIADAVMAELVTRLGITSILDFGCGRGADVFHYRQAGIPRVEGFDPHAEFGFATRPEGKFDLVTLVFVLNVLPDPWARMRVMREASEYLNTTGALLVVARSPWEIDFQSKKGQWSTHNDGFWSHEAKGTFQRGISDTEIEALAARVGLVRHPLSSSLGFGRSASHLLLCRANVV